MLGLPAEVIVLRDFTGAFAFSSAISITEITVGSLPEPNDAWARRRRSRGMRNDRRRSGRNSLDIDRF